MCLSNKSCQVDYGEIPRTTNTAGHAKGQLARASDRGHKLKATGEMWWLGHGLALFEVPDQGRSESSVSRSPQVRLIVTSLHRGRCVNTSITATDWLAFQITRHKPCVAGSNPAPATTPALHRPAIQSSPAFAQRFSLTSP